jgi:hypothetical protein
MTTKSNVSPLGVSMGQQGTRRGNRAATRDSHIDGLAQARALLAPMLAPSTLST